jgi:hypothetical protein
MAAWQHATTKTKKLSTTTGREKIGGGRVSVSCHFGELWGNFCNGLPSGVRMKIERMCGSTNSDENACCCREEGAGAGSFCTGRVLAVSF